MAKVIQWSDEQRAEWEQWVAARPPVVQDLAARFPADRLYRIKATGQRGTIESYNEDGTMKLYLAAGLNHSPVSRTVFGLSPDSIEECDVPPVSEILEAHWAIVQDTFIPAMRILAERDE